MGAVEVTVSSRDALLQNSGHMTRSLISNMAAVSETLLASVLVFCIGVSGVPLDKEAKQSRSCGYEVNFVFICSVRYLLKLVNGD